MAIAYEFKNGIEYAKTCSGKRDGSKVVSKQVHLGRVLDKERHVFQNRERGVFTFDPKTGEYGAPPADFNIPAVKRKNAREKLILDFGDAWFLDEFLKANDMMDLVSELGYGNKDSCRALFAFYLLCREANVNAATWLEGSYARILYPNANLASQRISDMLEVIGQEDCQRVVFRSYFKLVGKTDKGVIIDSTGLPNSVHFPLTAVSNHQGNISRELRLIYVVQQGTDLPLYFRYVPGNIVDVSTIRTTLAELKAYGINTRFALMDAGYLSDDNIVELSDNNVSFLTRMDEKRKEYKELVEKTSSTLMDEKNIVMYGGRPMYIERRPIEIAGRKAYGYVCLDFSENTWQRIRNAGRLAQGKIDSAKFHQLAGDSGMFVLLSSRPMKTDKVVERYYMRQQIEQVFDLGKNNCKLTPVRIHSEDTLRGHLMMTFLAAVVGKKIQQELNGRNMNLSASLLTLRNLKCKVFDSAVIPWEATRQAKDVLAPFKLKVPVEIGR